MTSMQVPINSIVEGEVDTAEDQQKRQTLISVTSDMVARLYSTMFLVDQATSLSSFGFERAELYKQSLMAAVDKLEQQFPMLAEFDVKVDVSAETGNIIVTGTNDFTNTILDFIRVASQSPMTDLAEESDPRVDESDHE